MDETNVALVQLCVDDRLDHARIRAQVAEKLRDVHLNADRIFLPNEIGGNLGGNFRNTLEMLLGNGSRVVFCAILHHDDCLAGKLGCRVTLKQTVAEMSRYLMEKKVRCPVYTGTIRTSDNRLLWGQSTDSLSPAA